MKESRKYILQGFLYGLLAAILCINIFWFVRSHSFAGQNPLTGTTATSKTDTIGKLIKDNYLHDYTDNELQDSMYSGLVAGLDDPYSTYYNVEEYKSIKENTSGQYEGVGIVMQKDADTGEISVVKCYEGSPGALAGLQAGDIIFKVDGEEVADKDLTTVASKVRDPEKESVHLTVIREGADGYIEVDIKKDTVEIQVVEHQLLDDGIGYLALHEFSGTGTKQFQSALDDLTAKGMKKLIIDLRDNPGGLLTSVCTIMDTFLTKDKLIVYTEDKAGKRIEYKSENAEALTLPMAVLVNGNSASASEIFSGAVKAYDLGTLVGEKTYGKGVVQNIFPLSDGSAVKLTISSYYTPDGNNIDGTGIEPDVIVAANTKDDKTDAADAETKDTADAADKAEGSDAPVADPATDNQLQKAIEVLNS